MQNELGFNYDGSSFRNKLNWTLNIQDVGVGAVAVGEDASSLAFLGPECHVDLSEVRSPGTFTVESLNQGKAGCS